MYGTKIVLWLCLTNIYIITASNEPDDPCEEYLCSSEVRKFQDYLTINTSPGEHLKPAVDFWKRLAKKENVELDVYEFAENYPIIVMKWPGRDSSLKSMMLTAHMDVVQACYEDGWDYPPFSGIINKQCEVVGRGAQEMKSGAIQYFEAMTRVRNKNVTLLRDVYIVITPDETVGSRNGMDLFVKSDEFRRLNVGLSLNVGEPNPNAAIKVFYQDKTTWALRVECYGPSRSSGILLNSKDTAEGACHRFYQAYYNYREIQYQKSLTTNDYGEYTVINYVGGYNPVTLTANSAKITLVFAIILDRKTTIQEFNNTLIEWAENAGGDIRLTTIFEQNKSSRRKIDNSNPYWVALMDVFDDLKIPLEPTTSPTITDANFIVNAGVPAFGISPQRNTPLLVFDVNERLSIPTFLEGICIYERIISRIASIPDSEVSDNPSDYLYKAKD